VQRLCTGEVGVGVGLHEERADVGDVEAAGAPTHRRERGVGGERRPVLAVQRRDRAGRLLVLEVRLAGQMRRGGETPHTSRTLKVRKWRLG